jgi:homoserine kinase type II
MTAVGAPARGSMAAEEIAAVLAHYDVGAVAATVTHGGGTANTNVVLSTQRGEFFLKRRNPSYAAEGYVAFDHRLMEHLAPHGVGTPLALVSRAGTRWIRLDGRVYELYPFMPGHPHDRRSLAQIAAAGRALAAFHRAVRDFEAPPGKEWPRYRDPCLISDGIEAAREQIVRALSAADMAYLEGQARLLDEGLSDARYGSLPRLVVHGDYHPGNVKYQDDRVTGIFDLDWATVQPRVLDLADGIVLFAGERDSDIDGADIRSLTQTWRPSPARGRAFMEAYLETEQVTQHEMEALPLFVRALWLSCRVEGMAKVDPDRRIDYLLDGLLAPLRCLDAMDRLT